MARIFKGARVRDGAKVRLRIYPGSICHLIGRRDWREDVFSAEIDRQEFRKMLVEAWQKTGWPVHA